MAGTAPMNFPVPGSLPKDGNTLLLYSLGGALCDVVGGVSGENTVIAAHQECPLEQPGALVVEKVFVPMVFDKFGNDHDDAPVGMLF